MRKVVLLESCIGILLILLFSTSSVIAGIAFKPDQKSGVGVEGEKVKARKLTSKDVKIEAGRVIVSSDKSWKGDLFSGGKPGEESGVCQLELGNSATEGTVCNVACSPDSKTASNNSEQFFKVQSHVNLFARQYQDENIDLSVKGPGGFIKIYRIYTNEKWQFEHEYNTLGVSAAQAGNILKSGMTYRKSKDGLYHYKSFFIRQVGERYRWENKNGDYVLFSPKGKMLESGNSFGILARYRYKDEQLISINDRNNSPVYLFHYDISGKVNRVSDQHGREIIYDWEGDHLVKVTDVLGNSVLYSYNQDGRLVSKADGAGRKFYIAYHPDGAVRNVLSQKGGGHSFSYKQSKDGNEYYARVSSTMGNIQEYWFDAAGETIRIKENDHVIREDTWTEDERISVDQLGYKTTRTYDLYDNLLKVEYEDGSSVEYLYDIDNNLTTAINELGIKKRYSYNKQGAVLKFWAAYGSKEEVLTEYAYDERGNRIRSTIKAENGIVETRFTYDEKDNLVKITDPLGGEHTYEYDYMGNVVKETDAAGLSNIMVYDLKGRLLKIRYPGGQTLSSVYDAADRLISETDGEGNTTFYSYDPQDNLIKIKDPMGGIIRYTFDNDNRLTKKIDEEGKYHVFFYVGGSSLVSKIIDGSGNEINITYRGFENCGNCPTTFHRKPVRIQFPTFVRQFKYDSRGRLEEKSDLLGSVFYTDKYTYDKAGRMVGRIDKGGNTTSWEYDNLNRVVSIIDPNSDRTLFTYDRLGNLITLTDPSGKVTRYEYDLLGHKTVEIRPTGSLLEYSYDSAGRLLQRRDSKGQEISYVYDKKTGYLDGYMLKKDKRKLLGETVDFSYDSKGRLIGYDDGVTSATYEYDILGRRTSTSVDYKSFVSRHSYTYYKNGLKKTYTAPDGLVHSYRYTAINTLEEVNIYGVGSIGFDSYKWLRPERIISPGVEQRDQIDDFLRLAGRKTRAGGKIVLDLGYKYNAVDNIITRRAGERVTGYSYDRLQRLIAEDKDNQLPEVYRFDNSGNLSSTSSVKEYQYDKGHQLVAVGETTYEYDIDGNTLEKKTKDGVTRFLYNFENRVSSVVKDGVKIHYYYDPFGRRLLKDVNGEHTWFAYSDEGLVAEFNDDGDILTSYTWQPDGLWTTDPILLSKAGKHYFYHNDQLGIPQTLTDTEGNIVWLASYNSFGVIKIEKEEVSNNIRLPGQYYDKETGLHYNWHRYYEPETGRYLSTNPIGLDGGMNLFSYVNGNPLNWVDTKGLSVKSAVGQETYGLHWDGPASNQHENQLRDLCRGTACPAKRNSLSETEIPPHVTKEYDTPPGRSGEGERKYVENTDLQSLLLDPKSSGLLYGQQCVEESRIAEKEYNRLTGGWIASARPRRDIAEYRQPWSRP